MQNESNLTEKDEDIMNTSTHERILMVTPELISVNENDQIESGSDNHDGDSEDDERELAELFRSWSTKFKEKFASFRDNIQHRLTHTSQLLLHPKTTCNKILVDVKQEMLLSTEAKAMHSAFAIPLYFLERDDQKRPVASIVFSLIKVERVQQISRHSNSPRNWNYAFSIDLSYQGVKWIIERRLSELLRLHAILTWKHLTGGNTSPRIPPFPAPNHFQTYWDSLVQGVTRRTTSALKMFKRAEFAPNTPSVNDENVNLWEETIGEYLKNLLSTMNMHASSELCEFLEVSTVGILTSLSGPVRGLRLAESTQIIQERNQVIPCRKGKEGFLKRELTGGNPWWLRWINHFLCFLFRVKYNEDSGNGLYWVISKPNHLVFIKNVSDVRPVEVWMATQVSNASPDGNLMTVKYNHLTRRTQIILNGQQHGKMILNCESRTQGQVWIRTIQSMLCESPYSGSNRFDSFAPIRKSNLALNGTTNGHAVQNETARNGLQRGSLNRVTWLIDAEEYFKVLLDCILGAKEEILIQGWWVSPEVYLLRPPALHPESRLDHVLQRKAKEGVRIYVLVFKEVYRSLPINSYHTKTALEALHPNIRVQRHPDHLMLTSSTQSASLAPPSSTSTLFYTHHEKLVVIDRRVAFLGGLDLCYGRWDTAHHRLTDLAATSLNHNNSQSLWTGLDYTNPRITDFKNVAGGYSESLLDRSSMPRMPWHDVQIGLEGPAVQDAVWHFVQSWNNVKRLKAMHKTSHISFLLPCQGDGRNSFFNEDGRLSSYKASISLDAVQFVRSIGPWSIGLTDKETSILAAYIHLINTSEHTIYLENQYFITRCLSSYDEGNVAGGVTNGIGKALVERIVRAHREGMAFRVAVLRPLMPAFAAALHLPEASCVRIVMQFQEKSIAKGPASLIELLRHKYGISDPSKYIRFYGLRVWDKFKCPESQSNNANGLGDEMTTEQVYVHSKLMLVDDCRAICGSANINDRSMCGDRDSELAVVLEGAEAVRSLRLQLLAEHMDIPLEMAQKIDGEKAVWWWDAMWLQAHANTKAFAEAFGRPLPDNTIRTWDDYDAHLRFKEEGIDRMDEIQRTAILTKVKGRLVIYPTKFLCDEDLTASYLTYENFLPNEVFC